MAGSGKQAEESLRAAVEKYSGKYVCVVKGSIPTRENGIYMKLAGRPAVEVLEDDRTLEVLRSYSFAANAVRAGTVYRSPSGVVTLRTRVGGNRVLDMSSGEQLPRIC